MDYATRDKVKEASEVTQSPYFMAMDQKDVSTTQKISDHELVESDYIKKAEEPTDDMFEYVMIDSVLNKAKEDLWGQQMAASKIMEESEAQDNDFVQL